MAALVFLQHIVHVLEKLQVSALVGGHCDGLCIFLDGAMDNLLHRAVVPEVDYFGTGRLKNAPHDIDRSVVPIEQRGGSYNAYVVLSGINW